MGCPLRSKGAHTASVSGREWLAPAASAHRFETSRRRTEAGRASTACSCGPPLRTPRVPSAHYPRKRQFLMTGKALIEDLKHHVLETMRAEANCAPLGRGLRNFEIEELCGLGLHLDHHDHYVTYSILHVLIREGTVQVVRLRDKDPTRYRLR